jgi:molecular chaperone GrpE
MTQKKDDLQKKIDQAQKEATEKDQKTEPKQSELEQTKQKLEGMTEMAKRTMADLQNLRRRQEEEKGMWIKMANAELIGALLPVLDNLNRALKHLPQEAKENENLKKWSEGIQMSINQGTAIFEEAGLTPIISIGQPFNPDLHEALLQGPGEKDVVIEELEKGYKIGNRVIRHAKVKVGTGEKE